MHDQWEYRLLTAHGSGQCLTDEDGIEYGKLSGELLNRLGKEGWEVCGHNCSCMSPLRVILKRKVQSARNSGSLSGRRRTQTQ
jgi:hypothetical protein